MQGPGGGHRDGGPDPGAEEQGQHEQPVQRLRGVLQPDARLLGVRPPVLGHQLAHDPFVPVHDAAPARA